MHMRGRPAIIRFIQGRTLTVVTLPMWSVSFSWAVRSGSRAHGRNLTDTVLPTTSSLLMAGNHLNLMWLSSYSTKASLLSICPSLQTTGSPFRRLNRCPHVRQSGVCISTLSP